MSRQTRHDDLFAEPLDAENAKRNAVLQSAAQLFLDQGFEPVSMDAIAAKAEVSKRTVYSYFASKAELFAAIMIAHCNSMGGIALPDPAAGVGQDPKKVLTEFGRVFLRMITTRRATMMQRVIFREAERFPEVGRIFFETCPVRHLDALGTYLSQAHREGRLHVEDPALAANYFICIVKAPYHLGQLCGLIGEIQEAELREAVDSAVDVFIRAYAPRVSAGKAITRERHPAR